MLMQIDDIKVRHRVRKDLGDIEALKDSLKRYGLMNPITINSRNELVAGQRRLEAAKALGWEKIPVQVVDVLDKADLLELELEENTQRFDFSQEELLEGYSKLEKLRHPSLFTRIYEKVKEFFCGIKETSAQKREEQIQRSLRIGILGLAGLLLVILAAVCRALNLLGAIVSGLLSMIGVVLLMVGLVYFLRYITLRRNL